MVITRDEAIIVIYKVTKKIIREIAGETYNIVLLRLSNPLC